MGLDIYAGTLTRYYSKNWKSIVQQRAEMEGWGFEVIRQHDVPAEEEISVEEILEIMQQWCNVVADALSSSTGGSFEPWEEDNEKDYFTNKPDWCAWGTLLMYGACLFYDLPLPQTVKKDWDWTKDPLINRAIEDEERRWSLFSQGAEWWLPFNDSFSFRFQTPNGNEITMGTTAGLLYELRTINELGWNADEPTILGWVDTEGYPVDAEAGIDGAVKMIKIHDEYDTQSLARFAFSILYQAALFSEKHRVPIIMDY